MSTKKLNLNKEEWNKKWEKENPKYTWNKPDLNADDSSNPKETKKTSVKKTPSVPRTYAERRTASSSSRAGAAGASTAEKSRTSSFSA